MFTIDTDSTEYPCAHLAIIAGAALARSLRRSVTIFKDGEPYRFLRY